MLNVTSVSRSAAPATAATPTKAKTNNATNDPPILKGVLIVLPLLDLEAGQNLQILIRILVRLTPTQTVLKPYRPHGAPADCPA